MKRLFLRVYSSNENDDCDCTYATVDVTDRLIQSVRDRHEMAVEMDARDGQFHSLAWWDTNAFFVDDTEAYDTLAELYGEKVRDSLWADGEPWVEPHTFAPVTFEFLRTEVERMHIDEGALWWTVSPRHSSITLNTARISVKAFLEILEEKTWVKS